jgi:hypothetical protein
VGSGLILQCNGTAVGRSRTDHPDVDCGLLLRHPLQAAARNEITEQMMAKLLDERDGITISRKQLFAGPLMDNDNNEWVPAGDVLNDAKLRTMDWYGKARRGNRQVING